mmetsp:Transcript_66443/g.155795  ORF Transcript_66443/g.155795 Transcript_66443/m.155795 type:complete len:209 (-) Transcript_66443:894-1520(-)
MTHLWTLDLFPEEVEGDDAVFCSELGEQSPDLSQMLLLVRQDRMHLRCVVVLGPVNGALAKDRSYHVHYREISEGYVEQVEQDPNHGDTLQWCKDVLPTHTTADAHEEAQHRLRKRTKVEHTGINICLRKARLGILEHVVHRLRKDDSKNVDDQGQQHEGPEQRLQRVQDGGNECSESHDEAQDPHESDSLDEPGDSDDPEGFEARHA